MYFIGIVADCKDFEFIKTSEIESIEEIENPEEIIYYIDGNKKIINRGTKEYEEIVDLNSEKYNVDKNLIFAIIKAESNFNEKAHSSKGAKGLMQLMESTAKDVLKGTQIQITDEELAAERIKLEAIKNGK